MPPARCRQVFAHAGKLLGVHADGEGSSLRHGVDGIRDQVHKYLLDLHPVEPKRGEVGLEIR